jgi:dienelactone hydrolase
VHGNFDRLERFSSRIEAPCGARKACHWSIHSLSTLPERRFNLIEDTASQMPGAVARSHWGRTRLFLFEWACNLCVSILYAVIVMTFLISGVVAKAWATSMHKAKSEDWPPMLEIPSCDRGRRTTGRADSRGPGTLDLRGLARAAMSFLKRDRSFTTIDFNWLDAVRGREVPTRLYLPSAAKPLGSLPLIVFSHGLGGSRSLFCGNPFTVVRRALASVTEREALDRVADLRFALDAIQRSGLAEFLDDDRIVVAGHSFGANTALLAVGASVTRYQDIVVTHDARFKAALLISAPQFYGEADLVAVLADVSVPTLHVTSTGDLINIPGFVSSAHDRLAVFESVPDCRKTLVTYEGGTHSMFSDLKFTGGRKFNRQVKIATQELSIAFLSQAFEHDNFSIATWTRKWNSLLSLNFPVLNSAVG